MAQLSENFELGDLSQWTQSPTGRWEISASEALSGTFSLHHIFNSPSSGHDQISLPLQNLRMFTDTTRWTFKIRYAYPPSALNNFGIFLTSTRDAAHMLPGGATSGYVFGVNYTGSDDLVKLWRQVNGILLPVVESDFNWQDKITLESVVLIDIIATAEGMWTIRLDTTATGNHYDVIGYGNDLNDMPSGFFGIYYEYSSAQDRKLWFDDLNISGHFITDTLAPEIDAFQIENDHTLLLNFSESIQTLGPDDSLLFMLEPSIGRPENIWMADQLNIQLTFNRPFQDETNYLLHVNGIKDLSENELLPITIPFHYYIIKPYDIVINEIMADPSPPVDLPEVEYIELINTTKRPLFIRDWSIQIGDIVKPIPDFNILPEGYIVIVSSTDSALLAGIPAVVGVEKLPVLTNSGLKITLYDAQDQVISFVNYNTDWYHDSFKSNGGWSLEQIDPQFPCQGELNWTASKDPAGGSPGRLNSVNGPNPDFESPVILNAIILEDNVLEVTFNEPYFRNRAKEPGSYMVDGLVGRPDSVELIEPGFDAVFLYFRNKFSEGRMYSLTIDTHFTDCAGNGFTDQAPFIFGFPEKCDSLDIVINEILFNPYYGGVDFVEVYNVSDKIIDLSTVFIANRDRENHNIETVVPLSDEAVLFLPDDYLVLTTNTDKVTPFYWQYDPRKFLEIKDMPGYPNDNGTVILMDREFDIIDEFSYSDDLHFALLESTEGVSLEKIHPMLVSSEASHWHSAAEDAGFATPGILNSQFSEDLKKPDQVWVDPEIFSPDNDGHHDVVKLFYAFPSPGFVASIYVFNSEGRKIQTLANNKLLGTTGQILWDGETENGDRAEIGIYVILMELYNLKGELEIIKKTCILATRLR